MERTTRPSTALILALLLGSGVSMAAAPKGALTPVGPGVHTHDGADAKNCPAGGLGARTGAGENRWLTQLDAINLTGEQRQAIQLIGDRFRARGMDLAQRASGIREQMMNVSPDDPGYAEAMVKSSETAAVLAADTVRLFGEMRAEVHALLTDPQRQELRERAAEERKGWDEWRSRHKQAK